MSQHKIKLNERRELHQSSTCITNNNNPFSETLLLMLCQSSSSWIVMIKAKP
jgi:hypothetical protein